MAQNEENDVASVARYSAAFNSPTRIALKASADRGKEGEFDNKSIRETILSQEDITSNNLISSVQLSGHIKEENGKAVVFANTLNNGKNEKDIDSLDWKYEFPIELKPGEGNHFYSPNHSQFDSKASMSPLDGDPLENINLEIKHEDIYQGGEGIHTVLTHKFNINKRGQSTNLELPQSFTFYDQSFTHISVSENGFIKFLTSDSQVDSPVGWQHGVPIMYLLSSADHNFLGGFPDSFQVPTQYQGTNLNNSLFPIWTYFNAEAREETDIRTLWNPSTGNFVIGFYNLQQLMMRIMR